MSDTNLNKIELRFNKLKEENKKAFITYITAGLPSMEKTIELVKAQEAGGVDVIELGIPFSDPIADGPVIQAASFEAIQNGATLKKAFETMKEIRTQGVEIPIIFMMYFNNVLHYGIKEFVDKCHEVGVDGLIIPDLPFEEQSQLKNELGNDSRTILIQLVSPVSMDRIPMILDGARGFAYCVSSMGVTGQKGGFHKNVKEYLANVKSISKIPVMMGFGIKTAADVTPFADEIDGAIVGSHFINLMRENNFEAEAAKQYCSTFKSELNSI